MFQEELFNETDPQLYKQFSKLPPSQGEAECSHRGHYVRGIKPYCECFAGLHLGDGRCIEAGGFVSELPPASGMATQFREESTFCHMPLRNTCSCHTQNSVRNCCTQRTTE